MAILRSGKHTRIVQKTITKSKTKKLFKKYAIKDCFINLERINSDQNVKPKKRIRYNLRSNKNVDETPLAIVPVKEKKLVIVCESNRIWNELICREYLLAPGVIVLAKMNKFRPWPARINTIYRVGDVLKEPQNYFSLWMKNTFMRSTQKIKPVMLTSASSATIASI